MVKELRIIHWPDPRLKKISAPVRDFDDALRELAQRMLELMHEAPGVGLAAPQVGRNLRLFVMNATGEPDDDRVYVNPVLSDLEGNEEGEEGCLSLPGVNAKIVRGISARIEAQDLEGRSFEQAGAGLVARIWQHEFDHLNGTLLTDRMGPAARIANRKAIKELEQQYRGRK